MPVRVSVPVVSSYEPVMFAVSTKTSSSSDPVKLPVIWTVAPARLAESGSPTVSPLSIAVAPSPSV